MKAHLKHGLSGPNPGSQPAYVAMCHLRFDSVEAFLAEFSPHAKALQADISNYTDVEPVIQFSEERIFQ